LLGDLQYADLFGEQYTIESVKLTTTVSQAMGVNGPDPATIRAAVEQAADDERPALLRRLTKDMILDPARRIELDDLLAQEARTILTAMRDEDRGFSAVDGLLLSPPEVLVLGLEPAPPVFVSTPGCAVADRQPLIS